MTASEKEKLKKEAASYESRALETAKTGQYMSAAFHVTAALQKYAKLGDTPNKPDRHLIKQ